ncbi:MAG: MFS transporter [Burkholderiales bacterium]|nr:MFS transporter [Burkholderiales bacterium]
MLFNSAESKMLKLGFVTATLELYDFAIYTFFSIYFSGYIFPNNNHLISIIESYSIFVLGFMIRPFGGMFFSVIGDLYGRKIVLFITVLIMGLASFAISALPGYNQVGSLAPMLLLFLRLLQGFAISGELPVLYVYVHESIKQNKGLAFSIIILGVNAGFLLGAIINQILGQIFSINELESYAWRIPFFIGGILCFLSYFVRKSLNETEGFRNNFEKVSNPLQVLVKKHMKTLLIATAVATLMSTMAVITIMFMPVYLHEVVKIDFHRVNFIMLVAIIFNCVAIIICGYLTLYIRTKSIISFLLVAMLFIIPAAYYLISLQWYVVGVLLLTMLQGGAAMLVPYLITNLFPTNIRLTGVALSYNFAFSVLGGLPPLIISYFIKQHFNVYLVPVVYLELIVISCGLSVMAMYKYIINPRN